MGELESREPAVPEQEEWRVKYMGKLLEDSDRPMFVVYFNMLISCRFIHYLSDKNDRDQAPLEDLIKNS